MQLLVAVSDVHAGSTVGPCGPKGIELDDGQTMMPSRLQLDLYNFWMEFWAFVEEFIQDEDLEIEKSHLLLNGDLVDGWHHQTHQTVSVQNSPMMRMFLSLWDDGPARIDWESVRIARGTSSHVGKGAEREEGIARVLRTDRKIPLVLDPDTGTRSSYWHRFDIEGVRFDARHHGRMGKRAHTKDAYIRWYAQDIWLSHLRDGDQIPDIAIRSHFHQFADSGVMHKMGTRVVALPAWQHLTEFGHRINVEELGEIGGVLILVDEGEVLLVHPYIQSLKRPTPTRS